MKTLQIGDTLPDNSEFVCWRYVDGRPAPADATTGYHPVNYFRDGKYLGPDEYGIVPVFVLPPSDKLTWHVYWSPEGKRIATVKAITAAKAKRLAPMPYRRFLGEIYVELVNTAEK